MYESSVLPLTWIKKWDLHPYLIFFNIDNSYGLDIFSQKARRNTEPSSPKCLCKTTIRQTYFFNKIGSVCFGHINRGKNVLFGQTCIFFFFHTQTHFLTWADISPPHQQNYCQPDRRARLEIREDTHSCPPPQWWHWWRSRRRWNPAAEETNKHVSVLTETDKHKERKRHTGRHQTRSDLLNRLFTFHFWLMSSPYISTSLFCS